MLITDSCLPPRYFCDICGNEMPLWAGAGDRVFSEWLEQPCRHCGATPGAHRGTTFLPSSPFAFTQPATRLVMRIR